MRRVIGATVFAATAALLGTTVPGSALAAAETTQRLDPPQEVTGFILDSSSTALLEREAPALDTASVAGIALKRSGAAVTEPTADDTKMIGAAEGAGIDAELLISNFSSKTYEFDSEAAAKLLRDEENIVDVADQIAGFVNTQGWDSVNVDLESLHRKDGPGLTMLVQELQDRMAAEKTVSVDLMSADSPAGYRERGYQLAELAAAADVLVLMSYDLHGPSWSGPGPIGPLKWQKQVLEALLEVVPAEQVDLGIAGYGYSWPKKGTGKSYTVKAARQLIKKKGGKAEWKPKAGEWRAKLKSGTEIWYSDGRSFDLRYELAVDYELHGVALWRLGSADTLVSDD